VNKLTTSMLIAQNGKALMPTNIIILKSPEYSCIRICNVDDAKVIVIDRICTCSKLIFQSESNKQRIKTKNKKHTAQRREIKTNRVVQRQRNHKNKRNKT